MYLIVSRHPAAIEFIRAEAPDFADAPILAVATAEEVRGLVVAGNLPLHLAALAAAVVAVEFRGDAPRGTEYGLAEMRAAGASLTRYRVSVVAEPIATPEPEPEDLLLDVRSTNGGWGVQVLGPASLRNGSVGYTSPLRQVRAGRFERLGRTGSRECFRFVAGNGDEFALVAGDVEPIVGAVVVHYECLQSSEYVSLLHLKEGDVWREYGYKRRGSQLYQLRAREVTQMSEVVALASGIIADAT